MKSLTIAIVIALTICLSLFGAFQLFGVGEKVAAPLASAALGLITFIHDKVDRALSAGKSHVTPGIVPVNEFDIRWPFMLVYTVLTLIGIFELSSMIYIVPTLALANVSLGQDAATNESTLFGILGWLAMPVIAWAIFVLGRWVGIRSAKAGYWILPIGIFISRTIEITALYFAVPDTRPMLLKLREQMSMISLVLVLGVLAGIGILGVWRGNKVRFGAYFNSLLKQVSESTRNTLLAMTYEEAKASSTPSRFEIV